MRRHWIDNLRWVTVLLVLFYHVIYYNNNIGVVGGYGGWGDGLQYQDVVMYALYPWFMPLLFILAGVSARYALERRSAKEWFRGRTRKLLVPSTIGLFFFGFLTGFFNTLAAPAADLEGLPLLVKYLIWTISGTGPLWFIQVLWILSLLLLLIRRVDASDRAWRACGRMGVVPIVLMGVMFWLGHKTLVMNPDPASAEGLWNLYKPVFYAIPFLMGYFIFSHDSVQHIVQRAWRPLMACAVVAGVTLVVTTFGQDNTLPQYLGTPLNNLYGYLMCLAMIGWFGCRFNSTGRVAEYMTRSSYGIYIVHYLIVNSLGYALRVGTTLQPLWVYVILTVAVFTLSPLLYELLRRTPFIRWCVLGEKR